MLANLPKSNPFEELKLLGIAVRNRSPGPSRPYQAHIGILYRDKDDSPVMLLHFEAEATLKNEAPTNAFLWLQCALDDVNRKIVSSRCSQLFHRSEKLIIPYGISYDGSYFDPAGAYTAFRPEDGLTCATFVMAVFRWLGFEILKTDTWPIRPEDEGWQLYMIDDVMKKKWKQSPARIRSQKALVGKAARYRPEEVAIAAALYDGLRPLEHAEVAGRVDELEGQIANYTG